MPKKEKIKLRRGVVLELQWQADEMMAFVYDGGKPIISEAVSGMVKSYRRKVPKGTGRLSEGFDDGTLDVRDTPHIYYREQIVSPIEYAKAVEYDEGELGAARKARRSAKTKANKRLRQEIKSVILTKLRRLR